MSGKSSSVGQVIAFLQGRQDFIACCAQYFLRDPSSHSRAIQVTLYTSWIYGLLSSFLASTNPHFSNSKIRQVPDNQEVYLDKNGFTSLTFDITERVSYPSTDKEALEYHFADTIAETDTQDIRSLVENVELPNFL